MSDSINSVTGLEEGSTPERKPNYKSTGVSLDLKQAQRAHTPSFSDKGQVALGIGKSEQEKYGDLLPEDYSVFSGKDHEEIAAQNQSAWTHTKYGIGRFVGKVGVEVLKMPGYVGAAIGSGIDGIGQSTGLYDSELTDGKNFAESLANNSWVNAFEDLDDSIKEALPVFTKHSVQEGSMWDKFWSSAFWASEGADGLGYMASMFVPGSAIKLLRLGSFGVGKTAKLMTYMSPNSFTQSAKGLLKAGINPQRIDMLAATGLSTMFEAAAEADGVMKSIQAGYAKKLASGEITQEEVDHLAREAGQALFNSNVVLLAAPNFMMNRLMLGRFKSPKSAFTKNSSTGLLEAAEGQTVKHKLYKSGFQFMKGIGREGVFEEGMQSTLETMYSDAAVNDGKVYQADGITDYIKDVATQYIKTAKSSEGQSAILLGSLMGGVMSAVQQYRDKTSKDKQTNSLIESVNARLNLVYDHSDVYKTHKEGPLRGQPIINEKTGAPEIDVVKLNKSVSAMVDLEAFTGTLEGLDKAGKTKEYDRMLNQLHVDLAISLNDVEGGEAMFDEILADRKLMMETKFQGQVKEGNNITQESYVKNLKKIAKQVKTDGEYFDSFIASNVQKSKLEADEETVGRHLNGLKQTYQQLSSELEQWNEHISETNSKISELSIKESDLENDSKKLTTLKNIKTALEARKKQLVEKLDQFSSPEAVQEFLEDFYLGEQEMKSTTEAKQEKQKKKEEDPNYDPKIEAINSLKSSEEVSKYISDNEGSISDTEMIVLNGKLKQYTEAEARKDMTPEEAEVDELESKLEPTTSTKESVVEPSEKITPETSTAPAQEGLPHGEFSVKIGKNTSILTISESGIEIMNHLGESIDPTSHYGTLVINKHKKNLEKSDSKLPESTEATTIAKIEAERKDELSNQYKNLGSNFLVKSHKDKNSTKLTEVEKKLAEAIIEKGIKDGLSAEEIYGKLLQRSIVASVGTPSEYVKTYIQNRKDGKTNIKIGESLSDEINAKYDAKIKALQAGKKPAKTTSSKEHDWVNKREADTLKKGVFRDEYERNLLGIEYTNPDGTKYIMNGVIEANLIKLAKEQYQAERAQLPAAPVERKTVKESLESITAPVLNVVKPKLEASEVSDIEKRRQEELENTDLYQYDKQFKEFQTYGSTVKDAFDNLFEEVKNNPTDERLSNLLDYINERLVPEDIQKDSGKNPLVQEYIDDNQQNINKASKSTKSRLSKINAKYDAKIEALKSKPQAKPKQSPPMEDTGNPNSVSPTITLEGLGLSKKIEESVEDAIPEETPTNEVDIPVPTEDYDNPYAAHNKDMQLVKLNDNLDGVVISYGDKIYMSLKEFEKTYYTPSGFTNEKWFTLVDLKEGTESSDNIPGNPVSATHIHRINNQYLRDGNVKPGDNIKFQVNPNSNWNNDPKMDVNDLEIELVHNGVIVGILPKYNAKKGHEKEFLKMREEIFKEYQSSDKSKDMISSIETSAKHIYAGKAWMTPQPNNPSDVLKEGEPLAFAITIRKGEAVAFEHPNVEDLGIDELSIFNGFVRKQIDNGTIQGGLTYMLVKAPNGEYIPIQVSPMKVGTVDSFEPGVRSKIKGITNNTQWISYRESLISSVNLKEDIEVLKAIMFDPFSGFISTKNKEVPNMTNDMFADYLFDTLGLNDKYFSVDVNKINKGDYNERISKSGMVKTNLNLRNPFHSPKIELNPYSPKPLKAKEKSTQETKPEKAPVKKEEGVVQPKRRAGRQGKSKTTSRQDLGKNPNSDPVYKLNEPKTEVENHEVATAFIKSNLPQIPIEVVDDLSHVVGQGIDAYGVFVNSMIHVLKGATKGTTYHEGFHGVFRLLLTRKEQVALVQEMSTKITVDPKRRAELKDIYPQYSDELIDWLYVEEELADAYAIFQLNRESSKISDTFGKKIVKFFTRLWRAIVGMHNNQPTIEGVFNKISRGGFRKAEILRGDNARAYSIREQWGDSKTTSAIMLINKEVSNIIEDEMHESGSNIADYSEFKQRLLKQVKKRNLKVDSTGEVDDTNIYVKAYNRLLDTVEELEEAGNQEESDELYEVIESMFETEVDSDGNTQFTEFSPFVFEVMKGLKSYGIDVKLKESYDNEYDIELTEEENQKNEAWQVKSATARPDDNLSGELRRLFSHIKDGGTYLGRDTYYDGNVIFNTLAQIITNSDSSSIMMTKLENNTGLGIDYLDAVFKELQKSPLLQTQLFRIGQKITINGKIAFESFAFDRHSQRDVKFTSFISANSTSIAKNIIASLNSSFSRSPIVTETLEISETGAVQSTIDSLSAIQINLKKSKTELDNETLKELISVLNKAHLRYSGEVFPRLNANPKSMLTFINQNLELLDFINSGFNPFNGTENKTLDKIAKTIKKVSNSYITESYRNADNETIQTVVYSSYGGRRFNNLSQSHILNNISRAKAKKELFKRIRESNPFYANIPVLQESHNYEVVQNNANDDNLFEYVDLSAFRKKGISKGMSYTSMSKGDLLRSLLSAYKNNSDSNKYGYYSLAILADAPTSKLVKLHKKTEEEVIEDLYEISKQELRRIVEIKKDMLDDNKANIKSLHGDQGLKFHFIDTLNVNDFRGENSEARVKAKITRFLDARYNELQNFINNSQLELTPELANKDFLRLFQMNDINSRAQLISLTSGDPASYKSVVDFFKRNKQINSPGTYIDTEATFTYSGKLDLSENARKPIGVRSTFRTIFLEDVEIAANYASDIYENLIKIEDPSLTKEEIAHNALEIAAKYGYVPKGSTVNDKGQFTLNKKTYQVEFPSETDAQGYMTIDRWVEIQIGMGEYTNSIHEMVTRIKEGEATSHDISVIMQPVKPFYFGDVEIDGVSRKVQVKNSEYVLLPELANQSKKLKALLSHMEANNISSVNFDTAVKVGQHNVKKAEDMASASPIVLNNRDYRVQLETPAHYADSTSLVATQIRKLIGADIALDADYGGQTGKELLDSMDEVLSKTITESFNELMDELSDPRKMRDALKAEIMDRELGERYLKAIELDENNEPNVPFDHPFLSKISQNVFNSIFKKAVAKTKIKGSQLYNLSSYGFNEKLSIVFNENDGGIKHIECLIPPQALFGKDIPKEFLNEDGQPDYKLVPEKLLNLIAYRIPTEDKYSMFNLKVVGFLPNNGAIMLPNGATTQAGLDFDIDKMFTMNYAYHNSSDILDESEGFEAYLNEDVSRTSEPFARRDNANFDMTKGKYAYANRNNIWYDSVSDTFHSRPDVQKVPSSMDTKTGRDNMLIDMYRKVLSSPNTTKSTLNPGGYVNLKKSTYMIRILLNPKNKFSVSQLRKKTIKELDNMYSEFGGEYLNVADTLSNLAIFERNMAGKDLTGIAANHNAAHALIQQGDVNLEKSVFNFDGRIESSISEQRDAKGGLITKNISEILAAVVDNANDPLAGYANLNTYTADVVLAMLHNGLSIETALAFINQPIIRKFSELRKNLGNTNQAEIKALASFKMRPVKKASTTNEYSTDSLLSNLGGKQMDRAILQDFLSMKLVASEVTKLVNAVKSGDAGVGPTQGHNEFAMRKFNDIAIRSKYLSGHSGLLFNNNKSFVTYYQKGIVESNRSINELAKYPYEQDIYKKIKDSLNDEVAEEFLTTDDFNKINDDVMSFIASGHSFFNKKDLDSVFKNLPKRLEAFKETKEAEKYSNLLKLMEVKLQGAEVKEFAIEYNTIVTSKEQQELSHNSWLSMLTHGNDTARQIAVDLFKYSFARSGFGFGMGTFNNIAPLELYNNIPNFKQLMKDELEKLNDNSDEQSQVFIEQFIKNNWEKLNYIPKFVHSEDASNSDITITMKGRKQFVIKEASKFKKLINNKQKAFPFIANNKLGLYKLIDSGTMTYELVDTEAGRTVYDSTNAYEYIAPINPESSTEIILTPGTRIMSEADVARFNSYLEKSNMSYPDKFHTSDTKFSEFYDNSTGLTRRAPDSSTWILSDHNNYDLIDQESGEIYISNVNLRTGRTEIISTNESDDFNNTHDKC